MAATPVLNWKEIQALAAKLAPAVEGSFVERVVVPAREFFPSGFLKNEWAIRLSGRDQDGVLIFSVRPRHPYAVFLKGKGPKAAAGGTRSAFDLALSKVIRGRRVASLDALEKERVLLIRFQPAAIEDGDAGAPMLVLNLIPATPEALLLRDRPTPEGYPVLARTRGNGNTKTDGDIVAGGGFFQLPDGARAPEDLRVREELVGSPEAWSSAIYEGLRAEAFGLRARAAAQVLQSRLKQARKRLAQSEGALEKALEEPDYGRYGDLLKSVLHDPPPVADGKRRIYDYVTEKEVDVPSDLQLGPQEQVQKYYHQSKRLKRRIEESEQRAEGFRETVESIEKQLASLPFLTKPPARPSKEDFAALEKVESRLGLTPAEGAEAGKQRKKGPSWLGRTFLSKDGFQIWVGKTREENLELTFKYARGNDIWMHLRGRPGTHVVIPLPPKKSAPLETLLDAAALTIYFSGGRDWGKTEVDYTFRKHVKRIKNSKEVSYSQNKTLIVEPDSDRLGRLLGQGESA